MRLFLFILFVFSLNAFAYQSEAPENASLKMLGIEDGETYKSPIKINFVIDNMKVLPAGQKEKYAGHHHLLINAKDDINLAAPLPATQSIRHFGKGQTSVNLELKEGEYVLQLLFADHLHIPHIPPVMSKKVTIKIEN